ncbi:MAG TPA: Gfo/Idh/MocA family oxidoreductase, partial [Bacteroidales bacterium]|nr:Gfo/Idh/MocA family oxidoreductase [Bacteroidales bacterium]
MHQINWGIIGCGNVTELKSGPAFNKIPGSRVVGVMRRDGVKAADYARRHNVDFWYTDADELIGNPEINAVYIATPPASHTDYAIRVLKSGKPVYVEKPMAASYADCIKMKEASDTAGLPLFVAYYRRFLPYFIKIKEILSCKLLGKLLYGKIDFHIAPRTEDLNPETLPWRVIPEIAGAGYFYDLACHQLDLLDWYFGKPVNAEGSAYNRRGLYQAEDLVLAHINYDSGVPVSAQWCFAAGNNEHRDTISIFGEKGSLEFSTFDFTPIKLSTSDCIEEFRPDNPENIQYWFIKNMVEDLQGSDNVKGNIENAIR